MVQTVSVQVLGRNFKINCPAKEHEALHLAVTSLNKRLQDLKQRLKVTNSEHLITIVALNVCHELNQIQEKSDQSQALKMQINSLNQSIERILIKVENSI